MEEEVELRLYFEQKLNSLHSINMKYESKLSILQEKYDKLYAKEQKLNQDYQENLQEVKSLKLYKTQA